LQENISEKNEQNAKILHIRLKNLFPNFGAAIVPVSYASGHQQNEKPTSVTTAPRTAENCCSS